MIDPIKPVKLSPKAIIEVRNIMKTKNIPEEYGLRIGMKGGGGCGAGMSYLIGFDKKKSADLEYFEGDIPVFIEKKHMMYLVGLSVDFHESNDARGFAFIRPEESK
jgi:iron-sulfur cluster assembly protein